MEIVLNVAREKIRKKMLYITTILGIIAVVIFSSDMGSLTVGGRSFNDYYVLIPILINIVNFLSGAIALAMSVSTVPNEYERRTSHLIWSRGISQSRYHMNLAIGNVLISWLSGIILYITLGIFAVVNGYTNMLGYIAAAVPLMMIYTAIICMLTTAFSIKLAPVVTGVIMIILFICVSFRNLLILLSAAVTGFGGKVLKRVIMLFPDLAGLSRQAGNLVQGKQINVHVIVMGLLIVWIAGLGILFFRRKEA